MQRQEILDRRQLLALIAGVATGAATLLLDGQDAEAAKKRKSKSKNKSKSKGKNKDSKKQKSKVKGDGAAIVREAEKYKGSKYKLGGASPKGFDCSGFTWYVYNQVAGMDISRTVKSQYKQGKSVGKGDWQAGDIVFFKNTAEKGLSHCGIFVSGQKFIHAENEKTGVVYSELDSDYYSQHYAGARRLL